MKKSIIIIGAGMGGMAAGIYGQLNGYDTQIFEMHAIPGGQCTGWKRNGYTFDACIHHLFGCAPGTKINGLWRELGALPQELVYPRDCVSAVSADGRLYRDFYDTGALEQELFRLSPADARIIKRYLRGIRSAARTDLAGTMMMGSPADIVKAFPSVLPLLPYFRLTMRQFGELFSDPFLRKAFPLLEYSNPSLPVFLHLVKHAYGLKRDIAWPRGGSLAFAGAIAKRYRALGGRMHPGKKVIAILTGNGRAAGVRLADGTEHRADLVISDADGRKTIMQMLGGKYVDERTRACLAEPDDEAFFAVQVFFGVNRDLSREPSSLVMLLDKPVVIAGHEHHSLELQTFGFDPTMAPPGKGVIKVELTSYYSYWKQLHEDRAAYAEEKQKVAEAVLGILANYFTGIQGQVEATDVSTLMTWERFMGGTHGFMNMPSRKPSLIGALMGRGQERTLPGLEDFYFAGAWMTSTGALFSNAYSGKTVIKSICKKDGKRFTSGS